MRFLNVPRIVGKYKEGFKRRLEDIINRGDFILGEEIGELERELSSYVGVRFCVVTSSGTTALLLALMALGVEPGDEVITTPYTFFATAEMISFLGARPVFVDVDWDTFNINEELVEKAIGKRTKGIVAVSLFGLMPNMKRLMEIAEENGLFLVEDGAQSFGATFEGKKSCSIAHVSVTSFFPAKPLGGIGDGGAVFTNDPEIYEKLIMLRNHGQKVRYEHVLVGINARMDTIKAAFLLERLKGFEEELSLRRKLAEIYDREFEGLLETPFIPQGRTSSYAQYTVKTEKRDQLRDFLQKKGIPTAIYYPKPLHLQKAYQHLGHKKGDFPISERLSQVSLSLPMDPFMDSGEVEKVVKSVKEFFH